MTSKTLTRADICSAITSEIGFSNSEAADLLDVVLNEISSVLAGGNDVKLSSFGNFVVLTKKPRVGRNPKTGIEAEISARKSLTFRPSLMLKNLVNGKNNGNS